jgi:rare lipoprotein A
MAIGASGILRAMPSTTPREPAPGRAPARCLAAAACALLALLAGCASTPRPGASAPSYQRDGALPNPPADLERVPDAEPRVEPIRSGGANKPYEIDGRRYVPATGDAPIRERGLASWYGRKFHGRMTSNGERYDMYAMTAAHPTMPLPSYARVRNPANGREVIVRVNDRGPFHPGRVIDLSYTAALRLGLLRGVGIVEVERITNDDIRTGAWRRGGDGKAAETAVARAATPVEAPAAVAPIVPTMATSESATSGAAAVPPADTAPAPAVPDASAAAAGFWVQLGAFRQRDGALSFRQRVAAELDWIAPLLAVFNDASVHRLQAGPYASRDEASAVAERLHDALKLVPVIVERKTAVQ